MASNSSTKMRDFEEYYKDRQNRQARIDEKIGFDREYNNEQGKIAYQNTMNDLRKPASYKPLEKSGGDIPSLPTKDDFKDTNKENLKKEKEKKTPFISDILGGVKKVGNNLLGLSAKSTGGMDRIQFDENGKMYSNRANMEKELIDNKYDKEASKVIEEKYKSISNDASINTAKEYADRDKAITEKYSTVNEDDNKITKLGKNIAMELPGALSYLLPGGAAIGASQTYGGSYNRAIQDGKTGIEAEKEANKNMLVDSAIDVGIAGVGKLIGKGVKTIKDYKNLDNILDVAPPSSVETGNINPLGNKPKTVSKPVVNEPIQNTNTTIKPPREAINDVKVNSKLDNEILSTASTIDEPKFDNSGVVKKDDLVMNDLAMDTTEGYKQSKHATDTMQNSPNITQEVKDELKKYDFDYEVSSNKETYDKALEFANKESALSEYLGSSGTTHNDTANGIALIQKLQKEGKIEDVVTVTSKLTDDLTKAGKTVQAASILNRLSPEGRIVYTQRKVKNIQDEMINKTPGLKNKINTEIKNLENSIKDVDNKAAETLGSEIENNLDNILNSNGGKGTKGAKGKVKEKLTPEQKLANRVDNTLKPNKAKQSDLEAEMVNTLFNISKKNLPEKVKRINDPYKLVVQALQNKNEYHSVFNKAKEILKDKYGEGSEQLQILDDWINQKARPIFFENNMNKTIQNSLKEKNIKISELVKQHYSVNSKVRKDLAQELINKAGLSNDDANTITNYVNKRMKELTKEGKETVLKRMFADKKGKITKTRLQKIDEMINIGGFDNEKYKSLVFDKLGVPYLDTSDVKKIKSNMDQFHNTTDKDQQEILIAEINQLINDKKPVKFKDKLNSFRYINMLFNPKTLVKNFSGNLVNTGMGKLRDSVGSVIDKQVFKKTGIRTTSGSSEGYGSAFKEGARKTIRDYKLGIDTSLNAKEGARSSAFKGVPVLGKVEDWLSLGLQTGDRPFFEGAKNNFIRNYSKMNNIPLDKIPQEVVEEANQVGLEAVYQQKTKLGDFISNAKNKDGAIGIAANALLPFSQTPSAILDTAMNYTPYGIYKGAKGVNNAIKETGLDALALQRKGVSDLASGIVGTGAIGVGAGLGASGLMTGDLSSDYDTMQMQNQTGQQPYALKVGDTYNSLEFAQPAAMPLMLGADLQQNGKGNLLNAAADSMLNNSYLEGIPKAFADVKDKGWGSLVTNSLGQYASQLLPFNALANAINKTIDPVRKDTYDTDFASKTVKQAMSKYPGLNQMLPNALDSLGNEKVHNEGMNLPLQIFNNFINPSTTTKFTPTQTEQKLLDIYNTTGETSQMPRANAPTSFSYGGESSYSPTAEEQRLYKEIVKKKMDSINYNSDAASYEKALTEAYNEWKKQLISANGLKKKSKK